MPLGFRISDFPGCSRVGVSRVKVEELGVRSHEIGVEGKGLGVRGTGQRLGVRILGKCLVVMFSLGLSRAVRGCERIAHGNGFTLQLLEMIFAEPNDLHLQC